jgi:hypothetical protein
VQFSPSFLMKTITFCTLLTTAFIVAPALSQAQSFELGATIAAACVGSDGSMCDDAEGTRPLLMGQARWWASERFDLGVSIGRLSLRSKQALLLPDDVALDVTDRSRLFISAVGTYYLLPRSRVRPMLGLGTGTYSDSQTVTCDPSPCDPLMLSEQYRDSRRWRVDVILMAGLSGRAGERWMWRAGWQSHALANDENTTHEFFAGAGYRF